MTPTAPAQLRPATRIDPWPAFTVHTPDDVVVAAVALTRLVRWCGTPSVHNSGAKDSAGVASVTERVSVVVARIVSAEWRSDLRLHVAIDANLGGCRPALGDARVIGRQATVHLSSATLTWAGAEGQALPAQLPSDVVGGDLLVIPCLGAALLYEVRTV